MRVTFFLCLCFAAGLWSLRSARGQDFLETTQEIEKALNDYIDEQAAVEPEGVTPELIRLAQEQTLADPSYIDHYTRRVCSWLARLNVGLGRTDPRECGRLLTRFSEDFLLNLEIDVAMAVSFDDTPAPKIDFRHELTWLTLPSAWLDQPRQQKALVLAIYLAYADAVCNAASMGWPDSTLRFVKGYLQAGVEADLEMRGLLPLRRRNPFRFSGPYFPGYDAAAQPRNRVEYEGRARVPNPAARPARVPNAPGSPAAAAVIVPQIWPSPPFPSRLPGPPPRPQGLSTRLGLPRWIFWTGAPVALAGLGLLLRQLVLLKTRLAG